MDDIQETLLYMVSKQLAEIKQNRAERERHKKRTRREVSISLLSILVLTMILLLSNHQGLSQENQALQSRSEAMGRLIDNIQTVTFKPIEADLSSCAGLILNLGNVGVCAQSPI